jgi:hypothetical protein
MPRMRHFGPGDAFDPESIVGETTNVTLNLPSCPWCNRGNLPLECLESGPTATGICLWCNRRFWWRASGAGTVQVGKTKLLYRTWVLHGPDPEA